MYTIRCVTPDEIEELHAILAACGEDMQARFGLDHWLPPYPFELMRQSAHQQRVFAVEQEGNVVATFSLDTQEPSFYPQHIWEDPEAPALYLHRLAVHPFLQGQGIGTWCLERIEALTQEEGYRALRFDAYAGHLQLIDFYQKAGYQLRLTVSVQTPRRGVKEIACFEKVFRQDTLHR
jgi:GNAT superfamily N-acetyltransferase